MTKLFALFPNERDARGAIADLRQQGGGIARFAATLGPHSAVGRNAELAPDAAASPVGRWGALFGAFVGAALGATFAGPLGIIQAPFAQAVGISALAGGLLSSLAGWFVGQAFPDRNLVTPSRYCTHDKVVLKVGIEDDANEHVVRKMLNKHGAHRIVVGLR